MVQSERQCQSQRPEQKMEPPVKNKIPYLTNVNKKDKLAANEPEEEDQLSQLDNTNSSLPFSLPVISRETEGWMQHSGKEKGYKTQKAYIGDEDHFFRGEDLYGFKETDHKIGPLVGQDCSLVLSLPSGKQDEVLKVLSQIIHAFLGHGISGHSHDATEDMQKNFHAVCSHVILQLPESEPKYAVNLEHLSHLQPQHGLGVSNRSQIEDIPKRNGSPKKAPPGSGHVQKNFTGKSEPSSYVKKRFLIDSTQTDGESKKNLLYAGEDSDFSSSRVYAEGDHLGHNKMVVYYCQGQYHSIVLSSGRCAQSQGSVEIFHLFFDSKTSKHSSDYHDVRIKSFGSTQIRDQNQQAWTDSGGATPATSLREPLKMKRKDEDLEDFEVNAIDKNFATQCGVKGKNSMSLYPGGDRRYGDHPQEGWRNNQVDPMLKIGVACLCCHPATTSCCKKSQKEHVDTDEQDIFSSLSEETNPSEVNSEANRRSEVGSLGVDQSPSREVTTENTDSPRGHTEGTEQQNAEELTEHATTSRPKLFRQNKDSDTGGETSHHGLSREDSTSHSVFTERTASEDAETNSNTSVCVVNHVVDPVTSNYPSSLHHSQTPGGNPGVHFRAPVQVSSMDSEHMCVANDDFCHESYERSYTATPLDEDSRAYDSENHPVMMTQFSQSSQSDRGQGAYGGHTSVIAQEQACYFQIVSSPEDDWSPGVAEETVFSISSQHSQSEQPPGHLESHLAQSHFSTLQERTVPQNRTQSENRSLSESASSLHPIPLQSGSVSSSHLSPVQSNLAPSPHALPRRPPITVHRASTIPPWATETAQIDLALARNREFVQLRKRRATYDYDWPNHSGIDASNMALSGFFNMGQGRRVCCFYCGLELDHLTSAHNIWDEHVRHSPDCQYLVAIMGRDFVQEALRRLRDQHN